MSTWTPETWCACPQCNGPSLPRLCPDLEGPAVLAEGCVQCFGCGHPWRPDAKDMARAQAMWKEADKDSGNDLWSETVGLWRVRLNEDREKLARAMRGEW